MTTLDIIFNAENTTRFPVYCQYGGQHQPQSAYLYLDLRDGECGADYNGEMGSIPIVQWQKIVLTFPIAAETRGDDIQALLEKHSDDFQAILNGSTIEWDGSNNVGTFNDNAKVILEKLGFLGEGNLEAIQDYANVSTIINSAFFEEWLSDNIFPNESETVESFAEELHQCDGDENAYFSESMNSKDAILSSLSGIWVEQLYSGNDIPENVAKYLIQEGTCDDSQLLAELKEFAQA
jgi:hypothetical protein